MHRYRDPQLQMGENQSHLFNLRRNIWKSCSYNDNFVPSNSEFDRTINVLNTPLVARSTKGLSSVLDYGAQRVSLTWRICLSIVMPTSLVIR